MEKHGETGKKYIIVYAEKNIENQGDHSETWKKGISYMMYLFYCPYPSYKAGEKLELRYGLIYLASDKFM